jgi:hypothetical protein
MVCLFTSIHIDNRQLVISNCSATNGVDHLLDVTSCVTKGSWLIHLQLTSLLNAAHFINRCRENELIGKSTTQMSFSHACHSLPKRVIKQPQGTTKLA